MTRRLIVLAVVFLLMAGYAAHAMQEEQVPSRRPIHELPMKFGPWSSREEQPFRPEVLAVLGVDDYINRNYDDASAPINLYVGYYQSQRAGDTIHSPLNCLPGAGWEPVMTDRIPIHVDGLSSPVGVNRIVIQKGIDRDVVMYWYQSHGRMIASEYASKFYLIYDAIRLNRSDAALVRVISPVLPSESSPSNAEERTTRFIQLLVPQLGSYLPS